VKKFITLLVLGAIVVALSPLPAKAASYENTFYIAPVYEVSRNNYSADYGALTDLRARLGTGGEYAKIGFTSVSRYMNETNGRANDFTFNPTLLRNILQLSVDTNLPVIIVLSGGPWGDVAVPENPEVNAIDFLELDINNCQWKDDNTVPGDNAYPVKGLGRLLTLNNYNSVVKAYRKRNFQAAAREIYTWAQQHPDLFLGITTDPEVFMSPYYFSDYNPQTIQEFRDYERRKFGGSIAAFNKAMGGTRLRSFDEIDPPRPSLGHPMGGNPLGEEWTDFRAFLVDNDVQQQVNWAREVGLPANKIYTHQTVRADEPAWNRYLLASPLYTAHVEGGSIGITTLQDMVFNQSLFSQAKSMSPNWGIFEYNPTKPSGTDYNTYIRALQFAWDNGVHIISAYTWSQESNELFYNIKGSAFETAIRDFIAQKAGTPFKSGINTGEISGKVVNTAKRPIARASVRINNITMFTNSKGEFRFTLVHPGVYTIFYNAAGYLGQTQVIPVNSGAITKPPTVILSSSSGKRNTSAVRRSRKRLSRRRVSRARRIRRR